MRGTAVSGWGLLIVALIAAVVIVLGLYAWDSGARAAETALRPAPVAPLAAVPQTPSLPIISASPFALPQAGDGAPSGTGDAAAGQPVFSRLCNSCHPNANAGIGPALYGAAFADRYPEDAALAAVIRQGKGGMPGFPAAQLSDQDLANLIAYLRGLSSGALAPEATPTPRPRQRGG
jgi:mono/diheme cytochrome c family protein